ncbi:hypothetical protein ON010_g4878 [Phytophthora cinnamomi]|nr:hypothetical protein ON010_g4878 [Phytophthora cinnamomi]
MNQGVKPPRILFVRPKSAGSVRSRPQISSSLAPTSCPTERKPSALSAPPIALTGVAPSQPVRPTGTSGRRPSSAIGSRRCFTAASASACPLPSSHDVDGPSVWGQNVVDPETSSETGRENIYHVVVARMDAEDAAQQLARRIAHFRAQEERALRDMQTMRTRLEATLTKTQTQSDPSDILEANYPLSLQGHHSITTDRNAYSNVGIKPTKMPSSERKRKWKVPRSREQLEFLAKQKRAVEVHRIETARQQKELRKVALAERKAKEAELEYKRRCRKERIRAEEQQAIEQRLEKQVRFEPQNPTILPLAAVSSAHGGEATPARSIEFDRDNGRGGEKLEVAARSASLSSRVYEAGALQRFACVRATGAD